MKYLIASIILSFSSLSFGISNSSPVGGGTGVNDFSVKLYSRFQMPDGVLVESSNSISQLSYRDVWLGKSAMILTINGKKYPFKLNQNVSIQQGYPVVYGSKTDAGQSGQGVAVDVTQDYYAYSPSLTTRYETRTCSGDRIEVCLDFSHNGYGYECLSDSLTGNETLLIEYSEQRLPATVTLASDSGLRLAKINYMTKEFSKRTLSTVDYCDANSFYKEQEMRQRLRQRLKEMYGNPKKKPHTIKNH